MASAVVLISDMAEALHMAVPTLTEYLQKLRNANLINKTGRGTSAATMQATDAAALIAAVLASETITGAPKAAPHALALPLNARITNPNQLRRKPPAESDDPEISPTDEYHAKTFGDLLGWLLVRGVEFWKKDGQSLEGWQNLYQIERGEEQRSPIFITYCRPANIAYIDIRHGDYDYRRFVFGNCKKLEYRELRTDPNVIANRLSRGGFNQITTIDRDALRHIAASIHKPVDTSRNRSPKA